jgi:large subunit ribosomal protein L30
MVKVTQLRSGAGRVQAQIGTLAGLGLGKRHKSRILQDSPEVRGMIAKVSHLIIAEDVA